MNEALKNQIMQTAQMETPWIDEVLGKLLILNIEYSSPITWVNYLTLYLILLLVHFLAQKAYNQFKSWGGDVLRIFNIWPFSWLLLPLKLLPSRFQIGKNKKLLKELGEEGYEIKIRDLKNRPILLVKKTDIALCDQAGSFSYIGKARDFVVTSEVNGFSKGRGEIFKSSDTPIPSLSEYKRIHFKQKEGDYSNWIVLPALTSEEVRAKISAISEADAKQEADARQSDFDNRAPQML